MAPKMFTRVGEIQVGQLQTYLLVNNRQSDQGENNIKAVKNDSSKINENMYNLF